MSFRLVPKSVTMNRSRTAKWPLFCVIWPNLVVYGAHCVNVVDKAITMDNNLRLLCLLNASAEGPRDAHGINIL